MWFEDYDPYKQIFHTEVEITAGWAIIAGFIAISLLVERAWCRYLCPLGGFNGLLCRLSWLNIVRNDKTCVDCGACDRICPTAISVSSAGRLTDSRCIKCFNCIQTCPAGSLVIRPRIAGAGGGRGLQPWIVAISATAVFLAVLLIGLSTGPWRATPDSLQSAIQITSPAEVKGWMVWADVMAVLDVDEGQLLKKLGLPPGIDRNKTIREIRGQYMLYEEQLREALEQSRRR
ncbi:MAG: 4Fe-4S dicluster domain-containing protein [Negativicutes bacterium]|nr:4Fe-4S dicluster domain-containing protein [Negativicutes bacterium]